MSTYKSNTLQVYRSNSWGSFERGFGLLIRLRYTIAVNLGLKQVHKCFGEYIYQTALNTFLVILFSNVIFIFLSLRPFSWLYDFFKGKVSNTVNCIIVQYWVQKFNRCFGQEFSFTIKRRDIFVAEGQS